ncbi:MAG: aminotransferase class I/II-fold pyridoxal phosphate-dependent enzyme [Clostridioides sp.]|jgi:threonine aldolase|nr:aminotransferase class I/II-fold pyridoxal phosphate-dependent enzyme [Clostridioides sp.]
MFSFKNDYSEIAHPRILQKMLDTAYIQADGYGLEEFTYEAQDIIKKKINEENVDIHFVSGGTQANLITISASLRAHEAVVAAESAHIVVDETGAIEATGHRIYTIPTSDGKIRPEEVKSVFEENHDTNFAPYPKLVYISNPTELGTVYDKNELKAIHDCCKELGMYLFVDGARLACALTLDDVDIKFEDLPKVCDVFYIGGTKNGALYGEAIVICNDNLKPFFSWSIKQRGGLLSKTRVMALQFTELLRDELYLDLGRHANELAKILTEGIKEAGYSFFVDSPTNQVFPVFPNEIMDKMLEKYRFQTWTAVDDKTTAIRLVTSWATPKEVCCEFVEELIRISK